MDIPPAPASPAPATPTAAPEPATLGAYGLRFSGALAPAGRAGLQTVPPACRWPVVNLRWRRPEGPAPLQRIDDHVALIRLIGGGHLELERQERRACFCTEERPDGAVLAHPGLAPVGAIFAHWLGRSGFHAGAVIVDGGAWAVVGAKGSGKSTTLAWLAAAGYPVVTDDVLVIEAGMAFAGPRSVDLRPESARRLEGMPPLVLVRQGERHRLVLERVTAEVPFRGWVLLEEGEGIDAISVAPGERVRRVARHSVVRLAPRQPEAILELARLPMWRLRRPRRWSMLDETVNRLLDLVTK